MAYCLTGVLDKIKPICEMITRVSTHHASDKQVLC
jgi:hypothetical protein